MKLNKMEFESARKKLVHKLKRHNISKPVLDAMLKVPRHCFVPEAIVKYAYDDRPLPIGHNQTISAPHMVAIMCDLLDLKEGHKVLEIGAGSGYHAAVMAELVRKNGQVYAVERIEALVKYARENLAKAGYSNVTIIFNDKTLGYPEEAPYDRISVACAASEIPRPLIDQLKKGGKMIIPIGTYLQDLYLIIKHNGLEEQKKGGVIFVPLIY
ncbi:MAG: protein-L-isoaspartate O-methyltransferase [Methanosarcinales archaeon]